MDREPEPDDYDLADGPPVRVGLSRQDRDEMDMDYASADDLFADDEETTQDVTLRSGKVVQVRGLSRFEWFLAGKNNDGDANSFETRMVAMGMVTPSMTEKAIEKWRKRPGTVADLSAVSDRIRELSGAGDGADKSDVREVGEPA